MRKIFDKPLMYSTINTLTVALFSVIAAVGASQAVPMDEIDLRFIGPVAVFFLFVSLMFTYLPMVFLRVLSMRKMFHLKNASYVALAVELLFTGLSLLGYVSAMSGSNFGGVALLFISLLNLALMLGFGVVYGVGFILEKSHPKMIEWRARSLHESSQPLVFENRVDKG